MFSIEKVSELRVKTDFLIKKTALNIKSAETTLAMRSLQMAKCWLGKLKGELGSKNPYTPVNDESNIVPESDTTDIVDFESTTHLFFLNEIRGSIEKIIKELGGVDSEYARYAIQHFSEARFWFGFDIGNIRDGK